MAGDLSFAIIGCGGIGRLHAQVLHGLDGAHLVGVADVDPARAEALAEQTGSRVITVEAAMASRQVDAVAVCTPSGLHAEMGTLAARAGKHVLLEKPIDVSMEAADHLLEACAASGVTLSIVSQHRFDPAMVRLKQALRAGKLGKLFFAAATVRWWREQHYYDGAGWRGTRRFDGGSLLNQGIHYVDMLLWLLGPAARVYARCATLSHQIECEDLALVTVEFANGALGTIEATTAAYPGYPESLSITGAEGTVRIDGTGIADWSVRGQDPGSGELAPSAAGAAADPMNLASESHRLQYIDFIAAVRDRREPAVTGAEGRRALELVLAAYESSRSGEAVPIAVAAEVPA